MSLQPITIYNHARGPNPKKCFIILEELGIPYKKIDIENPKDASFTKVNPNGRLPAMEDPNNANIVLWESGAIVEYLVETYDKEGKLTLASTNDKWQLRNLMHFQMSGQGPYFGQAVWFNNFHGEDLPSAKKRYDEQVVRVVEVLNTMLEGKEYLQGGKCTYVDLAFVPWNYLIPVMIFKEGWNDILKKNPNFAAWNTRLMERASVKKVFGA